MTNPLAGSAALLRYLLGHPLAGRRPLRAASRLLAWQVQSRISPGVHREPWIGDSVLMVRRGMVGATGNLYLGLHEFADMALVLHPLRPDYLFIDIGANVGTYTVLAAKVRGARCISFEPDPDTAANLRANLAANAIEDRVALHEAALGAEHGEIAFTIGLDTVNRVAQQGEAQRMVPVRRLDDVLADAEPVMLKVDVEGHEDAVFAGADAVLARPSLLAVETESGGPETIARFARHGFERRYYDPFTRRLNTEPSRWHDNNSLYVRDLNAVNDRLASAPRVRALGIAF